MNHNMDHSSIPGLVIAVLLLLISLLYVGTAIASNRKQHLKKWPFFRYIFWFSGILSVILTLVGPIANRAHTDFTIHMLGHLLLGMLGPLLLVLAAPITLLLRTLHVSAARRLAQLLKTKAFRLVTHPIAASILNIGGLWLLYTTDLYIMMQHNIVMHTIIHLHVFLAGYVFTASIIYIEPTAHRFSYLYRSIVLILALAGHAILSKYIYANPPTGVTKAQAEAGSMLMYYGGDIIDGVIIFILCLHWYKFTRPRMEQSTRLLNSISR